MDKAFLNITNEDLDKLTLEELADLKIELDDLSLKIQDMLKICNDIIND